MHLSNARALQAVKLLNKRIGCNIRGLFLSLLAYADYVVLLAIMVCTARTYYRSQISLCKF